METQIKISEDITLHYFDGEDFVDISQDNEEAPDGFEMITITKEELQKILKAIKLIDKNPYILMNS